jgi:hypothetical protein
MMEAASTFETSVNFYQTTWCCNPEDSHLHTPRCEYLKSHKRKVLCLSSTGINKPTRHLKAARIMSAWMSGRVVMPGLFLWVCARGQRTASDVSSHRKHSLERSDPAATSRPTRWYETVSVELSPLTGPLSIPRSAWINLWLVGHIRPETTCNQAPEIKC